MLKALGLPFIRANVAVSGALLLAAPEGSPASAQTLESAPQPPGDEILVTAKRMQLVDITYSLQGSRLSTCTVAKSSGLRDVDVTVCAILNACIQEGHTTPSGAKHCLKDAINAYRRKAADLASLTGQYARNYDIQFGDAGIGDDVTTLRALAKRGGGPASGAASDQPEPQTPGMVVTGNRNPITAGQWQFEQTGYLLTDAGARTLGRVWFVCIKDGALHYTIDDMVQRSFYDPFVPSWCVRWNVALGADNSITGDQRCWVGRNVRMRGELKGHVSAEEVHLQRVMSLRIIQTTSTMIDPTAYMDIDGRRIGDCNPDDARPGGSKFLRSLRRAPTPGK